MPVPAQIAYPPRILIEIWDKDWAQDDELIGSAKVRLEPSALGRGQLQQYCLNIVDADGTRMIKSADTNDGQLADGQELTIGLFFNFTPELYYEEGSREFAMQPWEHAQVQSAAGMASVDLAAAEALFHTYITDFNAKNLDGITNALHPDAAVFMAPATDPVATGRATILPAYSKDFELGKKVYVAAGPKVWAATDDSGGAVVEVTLRSEEPAEDGDAEPQVVHCDVLYHYDGNLLQVRHDISNVRVG